MVKDTSRRGFLFRSPAKSLRANVLAVAGVDKEQKPAAEEHPRRRGSMISGVDGGLSWDVLAHQPQGQTRFTDMQEGWDGQSTIVGGYAIPMDAAEETAKRFIISPTPAHCIECLINPVRWRILVDLPEAIVLPEEPIRLTGVLAMVRHPQAPVFYRLHVSDLETLEPFYKPKSEDAAAEHSTS